MQLTIRGQQTTIIECQDDEKIQQLKVLIKSHYSDANLLLVFAFEQFLSA